MNSKTRDKRGFTLAELLIVVAIIAVLAAIAIPVFSSLQEKARRSADLQTARTIESILVNAVNDGTIQFPALTNSNSNYSVYVMISRDESSIPKGYKNINPTTGTLFCGADKSVVINHVKSTAWDKYQAEIEKLLTNSGINIHSLKVTSNGGSKGWDWIIVNVGYVKDKALGHRLVTKIYSGNSTETGEANKANPTNIEKLLNHQ